ncbi:hypothetical protein BJV77DRAFT_445140 [Russula vinacea]|nr:hypothetical protein BJV77DRAFT_445140 [Russula vinacea]
MIVHRYPKAWRRGITHSQGLPLPFNHCFQKDCNLRISAKKLMEESRPLSNYNFDEAVLKVQEWNEALRSSSRPSKYGGQDQLDVARQQELLASPIKPRFSDSSSPALASSLTALMPRRRGLLLRQGRMLHPLHYLYRLSYASLKNRRTTGTMILRKAYHSPSCKVFHVASSYTLEM